MRSLLPILLLLAAVGAIAQTHSSIVEITTVYSQNEEFYLRSVPYDNEMPSLRGRTEVYKKGQAKPLYAFDKGFDTITHCPGCLILSNDGATVFYVGEWGEAEPGKDPISVSIFRNGVLVKGFTEAEVTGCDYKKERCDLIFYSSGDLIDKKASNWGKDPKSPFK